MPDESAVDGTEAPEPTEAPETDSRRVELPKGHWVVLRDPWTVTERTNREFRLGLPDVAEEGKVKDEVRAEQMVRRSHYVWAWAVQSWGGPLLDGVQVGEDAPFDDLPAPLVRALDKVVGPLFRMLNGLAEEEESPTTP